MVSQLPAAPAPAPSVPRLHSLDALRAGALLLGIVLHGLMAFLPGDLWLVNDVRDATWPLVPIGVIHMFRMALFMAIAGYFSRRSIERHGVRQHLRGRVLRVLLPLFVFWPVGIVPLAFISVVDASRRGVPVPPPPSAGFQTGHLWFLWVLFQTVVVVVAARWIGQRLLGAQRCASGARRVSRVLTAPGGVLLAAEPYAVTMLVQNSPTGMLAPAGLEIDPVALFGFGSAFVVGWLLAAEPRRPRATRTAVAGPPRGCGRGVRRGRGDGVGAPAAARGGRRAGPRRLVLGVRPDRPGRAAPHAGAAVGALPGRRRVLDVPDAHGRRARLR